MERRFWLVISLAALLLSAGPLWADGDLYVIAGSGAPGIKITSLPKTIDTPGFYYLNGDLSYSSTSTNAITITSDDVTLDLMGFELSGPGLATSSNAGIAVGLGMTAPQNVEIRNGCLTGWKTGLSAGSYSYGIRALNLRTKNCLNGIYVDGANNQIKGCNVLAPSSATIGYAIYCGSGVIMGNTVATVSNSYGIYITAGDPCLVTQNAVMGQGTPFHGTSGTVNVNNAGF